MGRESPARVFVVHGWGGAPGEDWLPWIREQLELRGIKVQIPAMPDTQKPKISAWVSYLDSLVGKPDNRTFFVGHSIGCQTILRYLNSIPKGLEVGGVLLVAGFVNLTSEILKTDEDKRIAKPWLERPINWKKILSHTRNFVTVFSDNDPFVPLNDLRKFMKELNAEVVIEQGKGHMAMDDKIYEVPEILNMLLHLIERSG